MTEKLEILTLKFTNLTLFRLINFLRLKLQNKSAFGVDVNSEANSFRMLQTFKEFGNLTLAMIYLVSTLKATVESVKPGNIIKVNTICILDRALTKLSKYCTARPRFLPSHAYSPSLLDAQSSSNGQNSTRRKSQQNNYYFRFACKLAKSYQYQLL